MNTAGVIVILLIVVGSVIAWGATWRQDRKDRAKLRQQVVRYPHHGKLVAVRRDLQGRHRMHCLCYRCDNFKPGLDGKSACPIARATFDNCVKFGTVTPVWECPDFQGK